MIRIGFVPFHRLPFNKKWAIDILLQVQKILSCQLQELSVCQTF